MAFEFLEFTKSWTSEEDFPTYEPDENQVRQDLQFLHEETKNAFNRLIGKLNQKNVSGMLPFISGRLQAENVMDAIEEVYDQAKQSSAGAVLDGTIGKAKLTAELLERVYGGSVWVAVDLPGAEQNPEQDFPVGQMWLRPAFAVENRMGTNWTVSGGTSVVAADRWKLTADGSVAYLAARQTLTGLGQAGDRVLLALNPLELDDHLSALELKLGGITADLTSGGVFEGTLDADGGLTVEVRGDWPYTEPGAVLQMSCPVLVNASLTERNMPGCRGPVDWPGFLAALGVFDTVQLDRRLLLQVLPGQWVQVDHEVLPVNRGGTGLDKLGSGELLHSSGGQLQLLSPGGSGDFLRMSGGKPGWETVDQTAEHTGFLRIKTGTYTGTGSARTMDLGFTPKLIHIFSHSGPCSAGDYYSDKDGDQPITLGNGAAVAEEWYYWEGNTRPSYWPMVKLSGTTLTFSGGHGAPLGNRSGVKYTWTAIY